MKMVKAIVRPEKSAEVLNALAEAGFVAASKISILGRGKERGLKMGSIYYDEIPKETIMICINDENLDKVVDIIIKSARDGKKGSYGDGKIFILPVEEAYSISDGSKGL